MSSRSLNGSATRPPAIDQLVAAVALVIIAMTAIGIGLAFGDLNKAREEAFTHATFEAGLAVDSVNEGISTAKETVVTTAATPQIWQALHTPGACTLLGGPAGAFTVGRLELVSPDGAVKCSSSPAAIAPNVTRHDVSSWLQKVPGATSEPLVSEAFTDRLTGEQAVAVAAPIRDDGKRYVGAFVQILQLDEVAGYLQRLFGGPKRFTFAVVDPARGVVLSASSNAGIAGGNLPSRGFRATRGTWEGFDGIDRLFGSAEVPSLGWRIYAGLDTSVALAPGRSSIRRQAITGGAALGMILLLGLMVNRRILHPLRRLTAAVEDAGHDGSAAPFRVDGPAEIEQLAEHFNEVSERSRAEGIQNTHLAAASHELRGPLNAVVGLAETMIHHDVRLEPDVRRELLRRISASGTRMDRILTDLFDVLRTGDDPDQVERQSIDLEQLARRSLQTTEGLRGRSVEIDAHGVTSELDGRMVQRILENLLANAAKHAGPEARIWVHVNESDDGITIAVEDDGHGIPEADRDRIFERFERGHGTKTSGLGIGLSVVDRFARLHGGRAWVEERGGGGASFRVFLPAAGTHVA